VAPTATFAASSPIDEGSSSALSLTGPSRPSIADTAATFHYRFACDGLATSLATTYAAAGTSSSLNCPFADNGSYPVKGRIFDKRSEERRVGKECRASNAATQLNTNAVNAPNNQDALECSHDTCGL